MTSTPAKVNIEGGSWINGLQLFNIMQTSAQTNAINQQTRDLSHAYSNVQHTLGEISDVQYELASLAHKQLDVQEKTLNEIKVQNKRTELKDLKNDIEKELKQTVFEFRKQAERIKKIDLAIERFFLFKACLNSMNGLMEPFKYLSEIQDKEYHSSTCELVEEGMLQAKEELTNEDKLSINILKDIVDRIKLAPKHRKKGKAVKRIKTSKKRFVTLGRSTLFLIFSFVIFGVFTSDSQGEDITTLDGFLAILCFIALILFAFALLRAIFSKLFFASTPEKDDINGDVGSEEKDIGLGDTISELRKKIVAWLSNYPNLKKEFSPDNFIYPAQKNFLMLVRQKQLVIIQ